MTKSDIFWFGSMILVCISIFVTSIYYPTSRISSEYMEANSKIEQDVEALPNQHKMIVEVEKQLSDLTILAMRLDHMDIFDTSFKKVMVQYRKDTLSPYNLLRLKDEIHRAYLILSLK